MRGHLVSRILQFCDSSDDAGVAGVTVFTDCRDLLSDAATLIKTDDVNANLVWIIHEEPS